MALKISLTNITIKDTAIPTAMAMVTAMVMATDTVMVVTAEVKAVTVKNKL